MQSSEIRKRFLDFMAENGHAILDSASLVTTDEKGAADNTLFNTAGMQPLIPYLLGEEHPKGQRLASSQKCVRTTDIDEVGDNTHATFFEMLGNWSLGDYFKEEAISLSYTFLTDKEKGLGLDPSKLYITCFAGNEDVPKDEESAQIWQSVGIPENRIYFLEDNWWSAGDNGPCGPDSEMFYRVTNEDLGDLSHEEFLKADDDQKLVEIWNDVFMEFKKKDGKVVGNLPHKNVDTGAGLERLTAVLQNEESIFDTDLFSDLVNITKEISNSDKQARIVADHIKAGSFMIADGITPSNTDRGYVLRRILRRAIFNTKERSLSPDLVSNLVNILVEKYESQYTNVSDKKDFIISEINKENDQFNKTISGGLKEFEKISSSGSNISGEDAFKLFSSHGLPIDLVKEIAKEKGIEVNDEEFEKEFKKHQELSRSGAEQKFKGGLAGHGPEELKFHTATHLLHAGLREILGKHVEQKGSNITPERLRFDFSHPEKMTQEEKVAVEEWVNDKITKALPVTKLETTFDEAKKMGAMGLFEDKYGDKVSVYKIGDEESDICSIELCGGPHVENTSELGKFKIKKEEASSAGVRRIKGVFG